MTRSVSFFAAVAVWIVATGAMAADMTGFQLTGETWTWTRPDGAVNGILVKPTGTGPFPAVIISHGKGATVAGFSLSKAREFAGWGLVCIGCEYTHAGSGTVDPGASAENIRRALACVDVLQSLGNVDMTHVYAYGNSMGAFLTIGFAADHPTLLKAAAITAGGVVPIEGQAAPSSARAQSVRTPFTILHGSVDTTVPPDRSELFESILDANTVPNERTVFDGINHDLHQVKSAEVYAIIKAWFEKYGLNDNGGGGGGNTGAFKKPRGLYVLDTPMGTYRDGASARLALPFVAGFAWRYGWAEMEPAAGAYNFTSVDHIMKTVVAAGPEKGLTHIIMAAPAWTANGLPASETWTDGEGVLRPVPWNAGFQARIRAYYKALGDHVVDDGTGTSRPYRDHPQLRQVHVTIAIPFRENGVEFTAFPGYTRQKFLDAAQTLLDGVVAEFPDKFIYIGFWKITDTEDAAWGNQALWQTVRDRIHARYNAGAQPKVGFFMENLAAHIENGAIAGTPITSYAETLYSSRNQTFTMFQMLGSFKNAAPGDPTKYTGCTPIDAIRFARDTYNCEYVEVYEPDLVNAAWSADFQTWHDTLFPAVPPPPQPPQITAGPTAAPSVLTLPEATALSVSAADADTPADRLTYTWALDAGQGGVTFGDNGTAESHSTVASFAAHGTFRLRVTVSDGLGSATGTVTVVANARPVAANLSTRTAKGSATAVALTGSDADGQTLSFRVVAPPAHGTLFGNAPALSYLPAPSFSGMDTFQYIASDGVAESAPATVTVSVTQSAPTVLSGPIAMPNPARVGESIAFAITATDPDSDVLSFVWNLGDGTGASGTAFQKAYDAPGTYQATVRISDGMESVTGSVTVVVRSADDGGGDDGGGGPFGDMDGDGIADVDDTDADGDGWANDAELAAGTDPLDAGSIPSSPLTITKLSARLNFINPGRDTLVLSGILPGVTSVRNFDAVPLELRVGGVGSAFVLNANGRGSSSDGTVRLKAKLARNPATSEKAFLGGDVPFQAKLARGAWAGSWVDEPVRLALSGVVPLEVDVLFQGRTHRRVVTASYSARKVETGSLVQTK